MEGSIILPCNSLLTYLTQTDLEIEVSGLNNSLFLLVTYYPFFPFLKSIRILKLPVFIVMSFIGLEGRDITM